MRTTLESFLPPLDVLHPPKYSKKEGEEQEREKKVILVM
jgi:hypothetical protein